MTKLLLFLAFLIQLVPFALGMAWTDEATSQEYGNLTIDVGDTNAANWQDGLESIYEEIQLQITNESLANWDDAASTSGVGSLTITGESLNAWQDIASATAAEGETVPLTATAQDSGASNWNDVATQNLGKLVTASENASIYWNDYFTYSLTGGGWRDSAAAQAYGLLSADASDDNSGNWTDEAAAEFETTEATASDTFPEWADAVETSGVGSLAVSDANAAFTDAVTTSGIGSLSPEDSITTWNDGVSVTLNIPLSEPEDSNADNWSDAAGVLYSTPIVASDSNTDNWNDEATTALEGGLSVAEANAPWSDAVTVTSQWVLSPSEDASVYWNDYAQAQRSGGGWLDGVATSLHGYQTIEASDSNDANWNDEATIGTEEHLTIDASDDNSANWNDAVITSNFVGWRDSVAWELLETPAIETATASDSNAANWSDPTKTLTMDYGYSVWGDSLSNWSDAVLTRRDGLLSASDSNAANWGDAVALRLHHNLEVADDNSANWSDTAEAAQDIEVPIITPLYQYPQDANASYSDSVTVYRGYAVTPSDDASANYADEAAAEALDESVLLGRASDAMSQSDSVSFVLGYLVYPYDDAAPYLQDFAAAPYDYKWDVGDSFTFSDSASAYATSHLAVDDDNSANWNDEASAAAALVKLLKFQGMARDAYNWPAKINQAKVYIYDAGTSDLSTIYSDSSFTGKANPFFTDTSGWFAFYAAEGRYDVKFTMGSPAIQREFVYPDALEFSE